MKTHTGEVREVLSWAREMVTGEESREEMASLLFTTVAEMMTLFTWNSGSEGQLSPESPYQGLRVMNQ